MMETGVKYKFRVFLFVLLLGLLCPSHNVRAEVGEDVWKGAGIDELDPKPAPGFKLEDITGQVVRLKQYRGKVVLLNFWATWCPPCVKELPWLDALARRFKDKGLEVIAINDYESKKKVLAFVSGKNYSFTVLIDEKATASEKYRAQVLPTSFVIDRKGKMVGMAVGMREWEKPEMLKFFEEFLEK